MKEYHKIQTVFDRDPETKFKKLVEGKYANSAFEYLAMNKWVFTEKVDGTNIRVMLSSDSEDGKKYGITFGGKTDEAQIPAKLIARLDEVFRNDVTRTKLDDMFPNGGCLYGEGFGAGIQAAGKSYAPAQDFVLFDVKVGDFWLERHNVEDVAHDLGLKIVPIIGTGTLPEMVQKAKIGFASQWGNFNAEGIVARPACELKTRNGARIITKIKHKDF